MVLHGVRSRIVRWRAAGPSAALVPALFLLPLLGVCAPLGLAPLMLAAALAAAFLAWPLGPPPRFLWICLAALVLWSLLGALWAVDPGYSARRALRLAVEVGAGLTLCAVIAGVDEEPRRQAGLALVAGMALAMILLLIEAASGAYLGGLWRGTAGAVESYKRGSSLIALFAWPAASMVFRRWGLAAALGWLALAGATVLAHRSDSAILAYAVGILVFACAILRPVLVARSLGIAVVVAMLVAPLLAAGPLAPARVLAAGIPLPMSMMHRLEIWEFVADAIPRHLAGGAGLDSARSYPGGREVVTIEAIDRRSGERQQARLEALPLHPHNAALQIWLELGIPGLLLAGAVVLWLSRGLARHGEVDRFTLAASIGGMAAAAVVANLSYGLWQGWWIAALWLLGIAIALQLRPARVSLEA